MPSQHSSPPPSLLLLLFTIPSILSSTIPWTHPSHVDMSYPPAANSLPAQNSEPFVNGTLQSFGPIFKCDLFDPSSSTQPRVPWPATNGHVGLQFSSNGSGPSPEEPGYYANVQINIGQVSALNLEQSLDSATLDSGENWNDFTPRRGCSSWSINATERVAILNGGDVNKYFPNGVVDIVGLNATIEVEISLNTEKGSLEEQFQCGYVYIVTEEEFEREGKGLCGVDVEGTTSTITAAAATSVTSSASATTTASNAVNHGSAHHLSSQEITFAIAFSLVGFFLVVALLLFGLCYRRHARTRRAKAAASEAVGGENNVVEEQSEKQPPTYAEATEKVKRPDEMKEKPTRMKANEGEDFTFDREQMEAEGSTARKA